MLGVHIHMCVVVHSAEVEQRAASLLLVIGERLLEPYCSLIEEQALVLGVPVAGDAHLGGFVKVILDEIFRALRLGILEESPTADIHSVVIVAFLLYVDDVVPLAVQQSGLSCIHIAQQGHFFGFRGSDGYQR